MPNIFKTFDVFGTSVSWNVKSQTETKTLLGSLISMSLLILLFYIAWVLGKDMIYKSSPVVNLEDIAFSQRPLLSLNSNTFPIAITIQDYDQNNFMDPRFFKVEASHYRAFNSNLTTIRTDLELENCKYSSFPDFEKTYIDTSGLLNYKCIKDQNITIGKYWDDDEIQYFAIKLKLCSTNHSDLCVSIEEAQQILTTNPSPISLTVYVKNSILNTQNYEEPLSSFMLSLFKTIYTSELKLYTIYIREDQIITDSSVFQKDESTLASLVYDSSDYDNMPIRSDGTLVEIDFFVSNHKNVLHRKYLKAVDLFATLGGLAKFLYTACYILLYYFSQMKTNIRLLNQLYDYDFRAIDSSNNVISISKGSLIGIFNNNFLKSKSELPIKKVNLKFKPYHSSRLSKLYFSTSELICLIPVFKCCISSETKLKWKLYQKTKESLVERLDVSKLLLKIQEFNKLKEIIMSNEQHVVFKFVARDLQNSTSLYQEIQAQENEGSKMMQVIKDFIEINESSTSLSPIDYKLMILLENKLNSKCNLSP